jgi:hypothetical protein
LSRSEISISTSCWALTRAESAPRRAAEHAVGLFLGLFDRGVRGALGQHQRAAQCLVGLGHLRRGGGRRRAPTQLVELVLHVDEPGLGRVGAGLRLADPLVHVADARGDALDEVVDVARVVPAPPCLTELDGVERLRSQFHGRESNENSTAAGGRKTEALLSR